MKKLLFLLRYTAAHLNRNRQRSLFLLFCIAAGVAAIVSLRTLGLMIGDALTDNLQIANRGDIVVRVPASGESGDVDTDLFQESNPLLPRSFSEDGLSQIQAWAAQNGMETSLALRASQRPVSVSVADAPASSEATLLFFIEPDKYPFYDTLNILQPAEITLAEAMSAADAVVISQSLAEKLNLTLGSKLQLPGIDNPMRVTAIVSDDSESSLQDLNTLFFPFLYLSYQTGQAASGINANTIYLRASSPDVSAAQQALAQTFPGVNIVSTADLQAQNSRISEQINRLITTLGLVSLLIGGIGIINTMNVAVQRRAGELAVLKTLGMSGRQITLLFWIESFVLGIAGSLLGSLLGLILVLFLRDLGERLLGQSLAFAIYPQAILMGLVLGVVITLVFGLLPIISASRVRPNAVLAPQERAIPPVGRGISLVVIAGMTLIIGLIVGIILGNFSHGLLIAYGAMSILGLLTWFLWGLLWLLGRLPTFGSIWLKLAQRFLTTQRGRMASTLLAMIIGVFSLSLILLMTQTVISAIENIAEEQLGGNILAIPGSLAASEALAQKIDDLPQVNAWRHEIIYTAQIAAINGNQDIVGLLAEAASQAETATNGATDATETLSALQRYTRGFSIKALPANTTPPEELVSGHKDLSVQSNSVLLYQTEEAQWLNIQPGDTLTLQFGAAHSQTVTVQGVITPSGSGGVVQIRIGGTEAAVMAAAAIPAGTQPTPSPFSLTVDENDMDQTVAQLNQIPGVFVLKTSQFNAFLSRLLEQLTALPLLIAILSLFSSSVIIANTVSLATQERRRQIGIMKALGLSTEKVLTLLLLENGLIGLLGGVLGTGGGVLLVWLTDLAANNAGTIPILTVLGLIALSLFLTLAATLLTAYGAAKTSPLLVLRYE